MLVNILFILTPFLLPVLLYLEHRANFVQDPNTVENPYKLIQFIVDIIKIFTDGPVWMGITFFVLTKDSGNYFSSMVIIVMLLLLLSVCIPYCCTRPKDNTQRNIVAVLTLIASSALSRILAMFFITVIINYFFNLELYAFSA
ncbi:hypothetical protein IC220_00490 [Wolbachia endosymbiont of Pentalonia nigronervosa]|uniref:hypothetical protein n=1 Tax=Wolbachia endosymbiont of Pentalonia nigronervosa TaxID=1301914 RepID=UPI00165F6273|nr:hypothetical protein [Wolbachia endosymbiont of Pentalonia nigronervosa]MBD0390952.1 hypothetical protein [Wolbachia endosymbiont of Pentalonia nigronervosa]